LRNARLSQPFNFGKPPYTAIHRQKLCSGKTQRFPWKWEFTKAVVLKSFVYLLVFNNVYFIDCINKDFMCCTTRSLSLDWIFSCSSGGREWLKNLDSLFGHFFAGGERGKLSKIYLAFYFFQYYALPMKRKRNIWARMEGNWLTSLFKKKGLPSHPSICRFWTGYCFPRFPLLLRTVRYPSTDLSLQFPDFQMWLMFLHTELSMQTSKCDVFDLLQLLVFYNFSSFM